MPESLLRETRGKGTYLTLPLWCSHTQSHQHLLPVQSGISRHSGTRRNGATRAPRYHGSPVLPGLQGKESKAQELEKDQPFLPLPTLVPLTLGQPGKNWTLGTLLTLPRTHRLAASYDKSPGPSAESPCSGKRYLFQKQLRLHGCSTRGIHQSL